MSSLTSTIPATSLASADDTLAALAVRLRDGACEWERESRIDRDARRAFALAHPRADMLQLCDALGRSQSLGTLLGLLGPILAADVAAASGLTVTSSAADLTSSAPWFAQEPLAMSRDRDDYRVSGTCKAVIDAEQRRQLLVRVGPDRYALVPLADAGVSLRPLREGGLRSAGLCSVHLEAVALHESQIGTLRPDAFHRLHTRHVLWLGRALCSYVHALFDTTLAFVGSRPFRDGVLSDLAVVRHRLADLSAHPRILGAQLAAATEDGECQPLRVALFAETLSELVPAFVKQCQQLHGGRGFLSDFSVARAYRDCLEFGRVVGPRAQIRRNIAARLAGAANLRGSSRSFASAEHDAFRTRAHALVTQHVQSVSARWEENSTAVAALHAQFARDDVTTVRLKQDKDFGYSSILAEELMSNAPSGVAVSLMIAAGAVVPLLAREASPALRAQLWPLLEQGRAILSFGITEPDGGSDLLHSLRTRAVEDGDDWVLNGRKMFITNGPIADFVLVLARTSDRPGPFHSSFLVVPVSTAGVSVSKPYDTLGLRASPTGYVEFRDVRIPKHNVIGRVGLGMHYLADSISEERSLIAIGALALAWTLLQDALARTAERGALRPGEAGVTDRMLSWLARLDALRSLASDTAQSIVRGERDFAAAGLLKIVGSEAAQEAIECAAEAISQWSELSDEPRYTRALRDTRVFTVFAGTNETLRELVGASVAARARLIQKAP